MAPPQFPFRVTAMPRTGTTNLRERKKQLTREAIAEAALALAVEHGLANVTVEEIARLAFVSPRTVSNYFSCKEEAVATAGCQDLPDLAEDLAARPAGEPPADALRAVLLAYVGSRTPEQLRLEVHKLAVEREHPALRPFWVAQYDDLEASLRAAIAERTGTDPDVDVFPWLAAATAASALSASVRIWARPEANRQALPDLVAAAFDEVAAGLRGPVRA
ncbi:TetR family transcriptional regulator [Georgenia yuyongxinii]|uniref:TetR family transcriptional regulator n=2 Tax=Georgenia yuyongxinii TaxID=2589797 RepID=A0A552WTH2_9MICO|nr:TetR family transcriptional regulator [Georgenia yuyongxinii]